MADTPTLRSQYPGLRDEVYADLLPDGTYVVGSGETLYYPELLRLYPASPVPTDEP